jgi:pSer/pThr/pTyr-binding forkhead associated (FHA) protein
MEDSDREARLSDPTRTAVFKTIPRPDLQVLPDDLGRIQVEVVGGPMDGKRQTVDGPVLSIGRAADNDLCLALDNMVSANHARIVREGEHYWLEDLNSRNGTFFGDQQIHERTLIGAGTLFTVGRTCLEFMPR